MASKEQIQAALDELWTKYGNTLTLLSDAIDKLDAKDKEIKKLEKKLSDSQDIDIKLEIPTDILQLEKTVLGKSSQDEQG